MDNIQAGMKFKNLKELLDVLELPHYNGGFQRSLRFNKANKMLKEKGLTIKVTPHSHVIQIVALDTVE